MIALMVVVVLTGLCYAMLVTTTASVRGTEIALRRTRAFYAAQAGVEDAKHYLKRYTINIGLAEPFGNLDGLAGVTIVQDRMLSTDVSEDGRYTVEVTDVEAIDEWTRDVLVESTGWVSDGQGTVTRRTTARLRLQLARSEVFDYVYFINNWGWYYGSTIVANGNIRSNGQFDGGGYKATVNAVPRYEKLVNGVDLQGRRDDGGVYTGWNLAGGHRMRGDTNTEWTEADYRAGLCEQEDVGAYRYRHDYVNNIHMPNLTDLAPYEELAVDYGSSITIDGVEVCDGILGDEPEEEKNLYLEGTVDKPIVIDGPVIVHGNVVIHGVVQGKGSIYCGQNVYIPRNVQYKNGLTDKPDNPTEANLESWLEANRDADALGLFAREHIVVGNYLKSGWQSHVGGWVRDWRNESGEDCGADQLPNTRAGKDGVMNTADDDILEGDGDWTVEHYTQDHADAGLLPPGFVVGDPIPGSGEDTDGDAQPDGTTQMNEFDLPSRWLSIEDWAGNLPDDSVDFNNVATEYIHRVDGALYTNHTIGLYTREGSNNLEFNGCIVSRNEAIVYRTPKVYMNYDCRLLDDGSTFHLYLPRTWKAIDVVMWESD